MSCVFEMETPTKCDLFAVFLNKNMADELKMTEGRIGRIERGIHDESAFLSYGLFTQAV